MTDAESVARMIRNDARNVREVFGNPGNWRHVHLFAVVTHCAIRLIDAEDKAPHLVEEARKNLREAVDGYKRVTGLDG